MAYIKRDKNFLDENIQLDLTELDQNDKFHSHTIPRTKFEPYFSIQSHPIKLHRGCLVEVPYLGLIRKLKFHSQKVSTIT